MRVESFNSAVRAIVTLALTFGLVYGFIVAKSINSDGFLTIVGSVITFWFVQRSEEKAALAAAKNGVQPPPPTPPA